MIEANENIDLVTMRRQQELGRAQESYQRAVSEGRLAVRSRQGDVAQLAVVQERDTSAVVAQQRDRPGVVATSATIPGESAPVDPEVAWRHTRLAITAGLVVLLLVIWIWQKRAGR